jgi:hypothetical protein
MQRITRIYLGNCGYLMAWYDGTVLDLTDPETNEPTDTIFNLENGGGKTSLLALIFSCFDTSLDRFLKHLQNKNNHFSQYFSQDGLLGFILVEWEMPARTAGGAPYRLVVGQTVSIKPGADGPEAERQFFSFEAVNGLTLQSVPAPKLVSNPVNTMAEFSRWIHEEQTKHPDVYFTRKQVDWQRHLREERLIDLEMLQMQVNFSVQEGGFDTGFLNFTSESAFLQKFFHLTLDGQRASAVREAVAIACDKLRRKPSYQARLEELGKFSTVLTTFAGKAQDYHRALAEQSAQAFDGARMVLALQARSAEQRQKQQRELGYESDQRKLAASAGADVLSYSGQADSMTSLVYVRAARATKARATQAEATLETIKNDIRLVRGARALSGVRTQEVHVEELETQAKLAEEGLLPFRTRVDLQGALLRTALKHGEQVERNTSARIARETAEREQAAAAHRRALAEDDKRHSDTNIALARLLSQEDSYGKELNRHVSAGRLADKREPAQAGMDRWKESHDKLRREEAAYRTQQVQHEAHAQDWQRNEVLLGADIGRLKGEIQNAVNFLGEGAAAQEELEQLPVTQLAIESDTVDPDSPALPTALDEVARASAVEVSICDARLRDLRTTAEAIEETGVAGRSPDVTRVVARLRDAGVRSARAFNEYLADALDDANAARALVVSDPARFLGVSVAPSEMEKARTVDLQAQKLTHPVVVSPIALAAASAPNDRFVVAGDSDAAYNKQAAAALAKTLNESIADEEQRRKEYDARRTEALAALEKLAAYKKRFGDGQLAAMFVKHAQLSADLELAVARQNEASVKGQEEAELAKQCQVNAAERARAATTAAGHIEELQRFLSEHEAGRAERLHQIDELDAQLDELAERREAARGAIEALTDQTLKEGRVAAEADANAGTLAREHAAVEFYDDSVAAEEMLESQPRDLDFLRRAYREAMSAYHAKEQDKLGVLQVQLQSARDLCNDKRGEFSRDFSALSEEELSQYVDADHAALLGELEAKLDPAQLECIGVMSAQQTAKNASDAWHKKNPQVKPATPDLEALDDVALEAKRDEAVELSKVASERQAQAEQEADRAKDLAKELGEKAANDARSADMLLNLMKLEDPPQVELLALEAAKLSGQEPVDLDQLPPVVLAEEPGDDVKRIMGLYSTKQKSCDTALGHARTAFEGLGRAAAAPELQKVEPELTAAMLSNDFYAACSDAARLLESLADRIQTTQDNVDKMQADFDACVEELLVLSRVAISLLHSAVDKRVPAAAPYVAGKQVLKMRANFNAINAETRRQALTNYVDGLIQNQVVPAKGSDLVAEALLRMCGGRSLGIQVLRMVVDENQQYTPVDKISNSGGEAVVMAMFLYVVIAQLRAETQAKLHKLAGGPLILDNPFAKATSPTMWKAQRLLAQAMGVQLVFATAIQDYNTLGEFSSFVRLRRAGRNSKSGRWHLECVRYRLNEEPAADIASAESA